MTAETTAKMTAEMTQRVRVTIELLSCTEYSSMEASMTANRIKTMKAVSVDDSRNDLKNDSRDDSVIYTA